MPVLRGDDEVITVGVVSGGHFFSHFYLLALPPLFPLIRADLGVTNTQLGILISAISLTMLLQILVGEVVDRIGARVILIVGIAVTGISVTLAGLTSSYLGLLALMPLLGVGQSVFHPADYLLLDQTSKAGRKGKNFSIHTFGGYAGSAAAPLIVGMLGIRHGWRDALFLVGVVGIAYALFAWISLRSISYDHNTTSGDDSVATPTGSLDAFLQPGILVMFAFFTVITMATKGIQTFTPLLAVDNFALTEATGNLALTVFFTATAACILAGGVLADRFAPEWVIPMFLTIGGILMWATTAGIVPITQTTLVVVFGIIGGVYGLVFASRDKLVSKLSADGSTGRSFGFVFTGTSIGGLISPAFLGGVSDFSSISDSFIFIAGFFLLSGAIILLIGAGIVSDA